MEDVVSEDANEFCGCRSTGKPVLAINQRNVALQIALLPNLGPPDAGIFRLVLCSPTLDRRMLEFSGLVLCSPTLDRRMLEFSGLVMATG